MSKQKQTRDHQPVLIREVLQYLGPQPGQSYLDLTAGYGGHASAIIEKTQAPDKAVLVDRDESAVEALESRFETSGAQIIHNDFMGALRELGQTNRQFDLILADLGVSSPHLDEPQRGFSFATAGPLDMRMDRTQLSKAENIVNETDETGLAEILRKYGEEPKAGAIAKAIVANRPINDTAQLAAIIASAAGFRARRGKTHPATKSFQAIRIAVNDELDQLEQSLPLMLRLLKPGGKLAVISFHSLEDRLVKRFLSEHAGSRYDAEMTLLTKKPLTAGQDELISNPRARSAKLRAAAKIKNQ